MGEIMANCVKALDHELLRLHRHDTELFAELTEVQRTSGIMHGDRPICPFLRPYLMEDSRYRAICNAAESLYRSLSAMTKVALENDAVMTKLGLTEREERWARLEPGYADLSVTSRLDTFLSKDGFAFLEYNGENPAGVGDQPELESLFTRVPPVRRFLDRTPHYFPQPHAALLASLDGAYRDFGGKKEKPNIAIVDWAGVDTERRV